MRGRVDFLSFNWIIVNSAPVLAAAVGSLSATTPPDCITSHLNSCDHERVERNCSFEAELIDMKAS